MTEQAQRLQRRIKAWADLTKQIRDLQEKQEAQGTEKDALGNPLNEAFQEEIDDLKEQRRDLRVAIVKSVRKNPGLYDNAIQWGFNPEFLPDVVADERNRGTGQAAEDESTGSGSQDSGTSGGKQGTGVVAGEVVKAGGGNENNKLGTSPGAGDDDLLPGERGRNFKIWIDQDGEQWAVYRFKLPNGKHTLVRWKLNDKIREANGIGATDGIRVTAEQMKRSFGFGNADQILRKNHGNMHPLKKMLRGLFEQYGNVSWLRDSEYVGTLIMGFMEGWSKEAIANALQQTKWFEERTGHARRWEQTLSEEDRQQDINYWTGQIRDYVRDAFGAGVKWQDHISIQQIQDWALKVASGKFGDPDRGWQGLQIKINGLARKIPGTDLAYQEEQEAKAKRADKNQPDIIYEQLRKEAVYMLGYRHRPDESTLRSWAKAIANQNKDMGDWAGYLRKLKKHLHPYLDPDEAWQDRASMFKNVAQELLGRSISWNDKLLSDFVRKDADGNPVGDVGMTAQEFERMVRKDKRFRGSPTFEEEGFGLLNLLKSKFTGEQDGSFPTTLGA